MHVRIPGTFTAIKLMKHFANLLDKKLAETGEPSTVNSMVQSRTQEFKCFSGKMSLRNS